MEGKDKQGIGRWNLQGVGMGKEEGGRGKKEERRKKERIKIGDGGVVNGSWR